MVDIHNFCLNTPFPQHKCTKLKLSDVPPEIIDEYNLQEKATPDGFICTEVRKGMHGLPHAGLTTQELLTKRLAEHGCYQDEIVHGLWHHKWRPIKSMLVVDDFGVKCEEREHAEHLAKVLQQHCKVTGDWDGAKCIRLNLDWDCVR